MKEQFKLIALCGKSGAGKDTILNKILDNVACEYHRVVLTTTRPPRDGERDGVDYFFCDIEKFSEQMLKMEMVSAKRYREWYYGISYQAFSADKINIGCFSPEELADLLLDDRFNVLPIYIKADDAIRLRRAISRTPNMCNEVCRRFLADEEDFKAADIENLVKIVLPNNNYLDLPENIKIINDQAASYF